VPVVHLVTALAQQIAYHVLARAFRAPRARNGNEVPGGGKLRVESGVDGSRIRLLFSLALMVSPVRRRQIPRTTAMRQSNHISPQFVAIFEAYENRDRAHTLGRQPFE